MRKEIDRKVLFVGNGFNRLSNADSWKDMLMQLGECARIKNINYNVDEDKPFPLLYEEIYNTALGERPGSEVEKEMLDIIKSSVSRMTLNEYHERLANMNCHDIITTNYDTLIEQALSGGQRSAWRNAGIVNENRYSIFRHTNVNGKNVWHIHGIAETTNTIMMGYEHYAGALQKMRNYITDGGGYVNYKEPSLAKRLTGQNDNIFSWIDHYFLSNIYIVGFGHGFSEYHLWWLLSYRARRVASKKHVGGRVHYYSPRHKSDGLCQNDRRRNELLRALGVVVHEIDYKDKERRDYYTEILSKLRDI
jgi:hypothetical protein